MGRIATDSSSISELLAAPFCAFILSPMDTHLRLTAPRATMLLLVVAIAVAHRLQRALQLSAYPASLDLTLEQSESKVSGAWSVPRSGANRNGYNRFWFSV